MRNKRKHDFNDYFEGFLYLLAIICFVYFFFKGNMAKTFQPILIVAVLIFLRILIKALKVEVFFALRFSILTFIFVAMFLANEFGFYSIIPGLDKIEHLFSGVILTFVGLLVFNHINRRENIIKVSPITITLFSLFFSITMAGCWEIYEFTTDKIFGLKSQNGSLLDTMFDIICGTIGAVITSVYLHQKVRKKTFR
jgi:uncharacterized membrane protein YjdF